VILATLSGMPSRETRRDRADRATRTMLLELGGGVRDERIGSGVSLATLGDAIGLSASEVSRLERAMVPNASLLELNRLAHATGQRLSVKLYPGDDPIRDVAHVRLIERFRQRIHPGFLWRTEAPLPGPSSLRGWDALLTRDSQRTALEAETRVRDSQALDRRLQRKLAEDPSVSQLILLVADTRANRAALAVARETLRGNYPLDTREILATLADGRHPRASGIVIL
jgi:transcriptional regulator with XRE-family HTH domain